MLRSSKSSSRSAKQTGGGCLILFGLPFLLAGLAVGVFLYFPAVSTWWSARGWEEVPCWIEKADLSFSQDSEGAATQKAEASYRYRYAGRSYESSQVSLSGGSDNVGDFQERVHAQIRAFEGTDRPFRCFVNPDKPEQAVLFRDLRWGLLLMVSIFPTIFPLAGALVSIGGWLQSRKAAKISELTAQHPDEPWRWRPEWDGEAIQPARDGLPFAIATAAWILAVQLPLALAVVASGELQKEPLSGLALLPAALALIPLRLAWRRVSLRRTLGRPSLRLKRLPVSPGRRLEGELLLGAAVSPMSMIQVRVRCQRQITRTSGDSRSTVEETVWEHVESLSAAEARRDRNGVTLPLLMDIPRGLPCSVVDAAAMTAADGEQHEWRLEISSSQGGGTVVLPLPVFASATEPDTEESDVAEPVAAIALSTAELVSRLQARGIRAEFDSDGLPMLFDCPAGRFRGMSLFLLLFGAVWFVAFVFMVHQGAPFMFRLIWGVTSPLIIGSGLWNLLHSRRVEISAGELRILNRIGPFYSWHSTFEPRHFTGFTHDTNMQSGNQFYYRVRAETIFDKKTTLIDGITESLTAETLAKRLELWRKRVV